MANRDYDTRRYLGDDRDRWNGRERDFDEGYRGSDLGTRQERGPWQGGQGYSVGGLPRGYEDYNRGLREDVTRYNRDYDRDSNYNRDYNLGSYQGNPGQGRYTGPMNDDWRFRNTGYPGSYTPNFGPHPYNERDLGYDRGFGTYVARDRNDGILGRRDQDERGPFERLGDRLREGVRKLGKAPKAYTRSDDRVREDVYDRLMHGWVNAENVEVLVKNGEVTLTGFVDDRRDKRIIEDIVEDVLGVKDVHNQLKVAPEQLTTTAGAPGTTPTKVARS
ncbi:BON domain-containing protein [Pyxidicoccus sp. 3LG]